MSSARFARSPRCRIFLAMTAVLLMLSMVAIFHNSQQELDDVRQKLLRCEQQQESLNEQLQTVIEQKFKMKNNQEHETNEHLEMQRDLEQKLKDQNEAFTKEQMESRVRYEKLAQAHKILQSEHSELVGECAKSKKQQLDDANSLEKKLQSLRSELQKSKSVQDSELSLWKEKYNSVLREKERLGALLNAADLKGVQQERMAQLERILNEYRSNCNYKPKELSLMPSSKQQQQINKPLNAPETTRNVSPPGMPSFDIPQNLKSFNEQVRVSPGLYHIMVKPTSQKSNSTNKDSFANNINQKHSFDSHLEKNHGDGNVSSKLKNEQYLPYSAQNNRSLIINSVENFQIVPKPLKKLSEETETQLKQQPDDSLPAAAGVMEHKVSPLGAPRKLSTESANLHDQQHQMLEANAHLKTRNVTSTSSSPSQLPPLQLPPNQRKLPENVAPIPALDELLKNEADVAAANSQKKENKVLGKNNVGAADIDAAVEDMIAEAKHDENDDGTNNRYANVVNDMEAKQKASIQKKSAKMENNDDSGAHEIKDHDFVNDQNFNLPGEDDNNFFDAALDKHGVGIPEKQHKDDTDNEDEDMLGGDIAVRQPLPHQQQDHHLLDADNLNNEVAGDQGKEFPDGLRLEEDNNEDEDEDDYANLAARQQGAQAIRN